MQKNFYITTTLPYVNAEPHIGFAAEIIRADAIVRAKKLQGYEVFFNTGTDEHGQKLFEAAQKSGEKVRDYVDRYAEKFKNLKTVLGLSEDLHFVRTTDPAHEKATQEFWRRVEKNGYIYKKNYKIKYCVGCEEEKTESQLTDGKCPLHPNREIEIIEEENYFFKFSEFSDRLLAYYDTHPHFVVPESRLNEMCEFIKRGLEDFSISRLKEKMSWGIPVPGDDKHVMYVWFDALVNYISTLGWPDDSVQFEKFWVNGTPTQYCGKDNTRFQAVMWQAMLMAADVPGSAQIVVDGFVTAPGGVKMSKSLGNTIDPFTVVSEYGTDALRYFSLRELSAFEDSVFTMEKFKEAYNANLANGLGNLTARIMKMAQGLKYEIRNTEYGEFGEEYRKSIEEFNINKAMDVVWQKIGDADKKIQETTPFKLVKQEETRGRGEEIIKYLVSELYFISELLAPFLPSTSEKIQTAIKENKMPETLFPRKD